MDIEAALVSKIISTGQLEDVVANGIRAEHFVDDGAREMFLWISEHVRKYKTAPSITAVQEEIKGARDDDPRREFDYQVHEDALEYLIERFIINVKRRMADEAVLELAKACDDPMRARNIDVEFLEASRKLATVVPSTSVDRFSEMERRIRDYERRKDEGKGMGVPFSFPSLDNWTSGIQPHEFVTVTGFTGLGKSTLLNVISFNAWVRDYTPLIFSLEMEADAILRRFDAMAAGLDYYKLKQLQLSEDEIEHWQETAEAVREKVARKDIAIIDSIRHCTPDHVFAETVRHKPDLVVIDYLSLMRSSHPSRHAPMWQSLTEITQDLKQNARTLKIPILAAAQTNRIGGKEGAELDNVGYSLSVVHDSDIVLGLYADEAMREEKEIEIRLIKNRDGRISKLTARWDHEQQHFRELTGKDFYGKPGPKNGDGK